MTGDGRLVGNLNASVGYNQNRQDGTESVRGIEDALSNLGEYGSSTDDRHPWPETTTTGANFLGLCKIRCPVEGCNYTHLPSQGLIGHVPNSPKPRHTWNSCTVDAADLHELASTGTHPQRDVRKLLVNPSAKRKETNAAKTIRRIRSRILDPIPIGQDIIQVYVNPGYRCIEVCLRKFVPDDEKFAAYRDVLDGYEGIMFKPGPYVYETSPELANSIHGDGDGLSDNRFL